MNVVVQKYGGTSVGSLERIQAVAERVSGLRTKGKGVVAVVSAMSGETNRLISLAQELAPQPHLREMDVLMSSGEQVSASLLSIALHRRGVPARSFLGHQVRIETDSAHGRARIRSIEVEGLRRSLADGEVAVVAGFQGVDEASNITTLGRGGSDTSAVAIAAALTADACEILTDVDGVYTTDPRICPRARKLDRITYDEMMEMASLGAKVLQIRSVEAAKRYRVPVHVRTSFDDSPGTWVVQEETGMEEILVSGVTLDRDQAKITVRGVPDRPGLASKLLSPLAHGGIIVDMIIQNASEAGDTDMTFTVPRGDFERALEMVREIAGPLDVAGIAADPDVVKVSVVGLGMRSHAGVAARMFDALAHAEINIQMISTSEIKISVVLAEDSGERAVQVLHKVFVEDEEQPSGSG